MCVGGGGGEHIVYMQICSLGRHLLEEAHEGNFVSILFCYPCCHHIGRRSYQCTIAYKQKDFNSQPHHPFNLCPSYLQDKHQMPVPKPKVSMKDRASLS